MNGAELKTWREHLGLTVDWLAAHVDVSPRTLKYWEASAAHIPEDVEREMSALLGANDEMFYQVTDMIPGGIPVDVVLIRYHREADLWSAHPDMRGLPASFHARVLGRVAHHYNDNKDVCVNLVWFDPDEYYEYMGARKDSPGLRAKWAAQYRTPQYGA